MQQHQLKIKKLQVQQDDEPYAGTKNPEAGARTGGDQPQVALECSFSPPSTAASWPHPCRPGEATGHGRPGPRMQQASTGHVSERACNACSRGINVAMEPSPALAACSSGFSSFLAKLGVFSEFSFSPASSA